MPSLRSRTPRIKINRSALIKNYHLCQKLARNTKEIWPVIKANAYNLGAKDVVETLIGEEKVGGFFVTDLTEALEISALCTKPIAILHGFDASHYRNVPQHIHPVINHLDDLIAWGNLDDSATVVIHIDTGLNRLGLRTDDIEAIKTSSALQQALERLNILFWMTHYAVAEQTDDPRTKDQAIRLASMVKNLPSAPLSLAASAGIFSDTDCHGDIIRPGIALYGGVQSTSPVARQLVPVLTLSAPVIQTRWLETGDCVGYGMTWKAMHPSKIATLAFGYADGLDRSKGNQLAAFYFDTPCRIIGRVSMDCVGVDVTMVPDIKSGDLMTLINQHQSLNAVAEACDTIPQKILTSLGSRVHRQWLDS